MDFYMKDPPAGLCGSCKHSTIARMYGKIVGRCHRLDSRIRGAVSDCSDYSRLGAMDRWQMDEIAWVLENRKGGTIGFKRPKND